MNNTEVILAVDDERHMESVVNADFRQEIEAGTLRFLFALHGREALDLLEIHPDISIVTADIKMPEMDGLDMLRRIQQRACSDERYARIQTIVVTAYNDRANIREAIRGGAVDFLTKPYEPEEFREAIERVRIRLNAERQDLFIGHIREDPDD